MRALPKVSLSYLKANVWAILVLLSSAFTSLASLVGLHDSIKLLFASLVGRMVLASAALTLAAGILQLRERRDRSALLRTIAKLEHENDDLQLRIDGTGTASLVSR